MEVSSGMTRRFLNSALSFQILAQNLSPRNGRLEAYFFRSKCWFFGRKRVNWRCFRPLDSRIDHREGDYGTPDVRQGLDKVLHNPGEGGIPLGCPDSRLTVCLVADGNGDVSHGFALRRHEEVSRPAFYL